MRFIHTADWHLGRLLHGVHLTEDQAHLLDQFVELVEEETPDAVIIAGDIYDRAVPPSDAVKLLDHVLGRLVVGAGVPTIMIAGNHDSADRLHFGSGIFRGQRLHVVGQASAKASMIEIEDEHGPVQIFALPYAEPAKMREVTAELELEFDITCHDDVLRSQIASCGAKNGARAVCVAHVFAQGGLETESERPLAVGGADQVSLERFDPFCYTALGHLHRRQSFRDGRVQYSGSLMKYSFNEVTHEKSVQIVEIDERGDFAVEYVPLTPRRDLRRIEGTLEEVCAGPEDGENPEDYIWVTLHETGPVMNAMAQIRKVYPNALHVERPREDVERTIRGLEENGHLKKDDEIFELFFRHVTGDQEMTVRQKELVTAAIDQIETQRREA